MKIVINKCFGGFGLSLKAMKLYLERKGKEMFVYNFSISIFLLYFTRTNTCLLCGRSDPYFLELIE